MMCLSLLRPLRTKKRLIVSISILLVGLLVIGYMAWSAREWSQLIPRYTQWHQGVKATINDTLALPTGTSAEKDRVITALKGVSDTITTDRRTICSVSPLILWQQAIVSAHKAAHATCQQKLSDVDVLQKRLMAVVAYNENDRDLATTIAVAAPSTNDLAENAWTQQTSAWTDAVGVVSDMSVVDSFESTQRVALAQMTAIKTAWQEIVASHEAKDKQKYLAAQNALAIAIDGLDEVSLTSQQAFLKLASELESTSQKAFAD